MRRVVIESPFAGDIAKNMKYLSACLRDSLLKGEAPFASHGLYTLPGVLDDDDPEDRKLGMTAGFAYRPCAEATVVYTDLGVSPGMQAGIKDAELHNRLVERRSLGKDWEATCRRYDGKEVVMTEIVTYRGSFSESLVKRDDCERPQCGTTHLCDRCMYCATGIRPKKKEGTGV